MRKLAVLVAGTTIISTGYEASSAAELWGYIDHAGSWAVKPEFTEVSKFHCGFATVRISDKRTGRPIDRAIDERGRIVGGPVLPRVQSNLPVPVAGDGGWQYLDSFGKVAFSGTFVQAFPFSDAGVAVVKQGTSTPFEIIDAAGKTKAILSEQVKGVDFEWSEGMLAFSSSRPSNFSHHLGYIDDSGKIVISPDFSSAAPFHEGLAAVMADNHWYYVDKTGRRVIALPSSISSAGNFYAGLAPVALGGLPYAVESARPRHESRWGFINRQGEIVVQAAYELDSNYTFEGSSRFAFGNPPYFSEGLAAVSVHVRNSHRYGYINSGGALVIAPRFDHAVGFSDGLAGASNGATVFNESSFAEAGQRLILPGGLNGLRPLISEFFLQYEVIGSTKQRIQQLLGAPIQTTQTSDSEVDTYVVVPTELSLDFKYKSGRVVAYRYASPHFGPYIWASDNHEPPSGPEYRDTTESERSPNNAR